MADIDDLADLATDLYALAPEEFVAARTALAKHWRTEGDRELARQVGELPKPTMAAWLLNQLVRRSRQEVARLVELGAELREAQRTLAGDQMRALTRQRHTVVAAFARQVATLADELERPVSAAVAHQVDETLRAAVADADAGHALLSGRLTTALSYVGMGDVDVSAAVALPTARPRRTAKRVRDQETETDELAAARRRRLDVARAALADAEAAAARAGAELDRLGREVSPLESASAALHVRLEELQAALTTVSEQAAEADRRLHAAQSARDAALEAADEARHTVRRARSDLDELG
ncbi:MAG: hypothetical protein M3419_04455 [Actinomycetota bacterium]|nr:hypothetical protein [Actinomycetota bacterium]